MTGVTGGTLTDTAPVKAMVESVRAHSDIPACVGFGVRDRETARTTAALANGVVVGSAVVSALEEGCKRGVGATLVGDLIRELRAGVDEA